MKDTPLKTFRGEFALLCQGPLTVIGGRKIRPFSPGGVKRKHSVVTVKMCKHNDILIHVWDSS